MALVSVCVCVLLSAEMSGIHVDFAALFALLKD